MIRYGSGCPAETERVTSKHRSTPAPMRRSVSALSRSAPEGIYSPRYPPMDGAWAKVATRRRGARASGAAGHLRPPPAIPAHTSCSGRAASGARVDSREARPCNSSPRPSRTGADRHKRSSSSTEASRSRSRPCRRGRRPPWSPHPLLSIVHCRDFWPRANHQAQGRIEPLRTRDLAQ